ncbi:MAG: elongation factor G [Ruminococcaceae bacterium]|nr:elongation factor G [Oscillospiraceae bacterium]
MANILSRQIRNVCLLGHGGSGKTSLAEAMLYYAKETDRLGKTGEGNTVCDFDPEEIKREMSISASVAPIFYDNKKINFIDTPGYLDFTAEVEQALRVVRNAVIVIDAKAGVEVGAELAWQKATDAGVAKAFFINRMDEDNINFTAILNRLKELFGQAICPLYVPLFENHKTVGYVDIIAVKAYKYTKGVAEEIPVPDPNADWILEYRAMLFEALAQTSDELMLKYFDDIPFTDDEITDALQAGLKMGSIVPVFSGSAATLDGVDYFLHKVSKSFTSPVSRTHEISEDGEDIVIDPEGETALFVFKTVADPFVGKMSFFKVMNGSIKKDQVLKNSRNGQEEKIARIYCTRGKKQTEVEEMVCGDIGLTTKLVFANTNDTLSLSGDVTYHKIRFPKPYHTLAVQPLAKGDEDKISQGITKLLEEDLTVTYQNNAETKQMLISGLGEIHLDVLSAKLKTRFGTSVKLTPEKIAYRETIRKSVQAEGKHKKQSGGHGQYGHVKIEFSPGQEEGLTFTESIFGGSVPKNFHPAVEKGLLEAMEKGVLAGFPVVNLKANLYDGSYHDVDSSEMAFKLAAHLAYKEGLKNANPVILEPMGRLVVTVPDTLMGDVIGDLTKRRGKVLGTDQSTDKKDFSIIESEVPKSEMANYSVQLRALTQGRATFEYSIERYAEVPSNIAQKIIDEHKADVAE